MGIIEELRRRNVFRVGIAYVVVGWLVTQVLEVVLDSFGSPDWVMKTVLVVMAAGLPFALIFAWAFEMTPEGIKKEKDVDRSRSITHQTGRKLDFVIIGILLMALGYFAWDKFSPNESNVIPANAGTSSSMAEPEPKSTEKSIAVLPFVNMSSDAEQEYFSDGISEEILNALAKVKGLLVSGRTSSFAFKGENQDLRLIGEALGVDHILEGSVRKSGNTVRITAQLIKVDNGFHLWSETYDRELDNVFAIQDEIATAILKELKATLLESEETVVKSARTNTEAYELYLLAKQRMYERTGPTITSATELLDRAIAIDPQYAPAYAQRGIATLLLSEGAGSYGDMPLEQSQAQGKLYLDKALLLDPDLAEAWAGLGLYRLGEPTATSWQKATDDLQKALSLNPGLIDASNWLNNAYQSLGKPADGRRVVMDMVERDPLYRPGVRNAVNNYLWMGEPERALAHINRVRPLIPNDSVISSSEAAIMYFQGRIAEGSVLADAAVELQSTNSIARLTRSFLLLDSHQYERVVEEGEEWHPVLALTYLGRSEEASILAFKRADEFADVTTLFAFLNMADRSDELIAYLEERWLDLDALREDFPPYGGFGDDLMINVALAYSRAGNQQRFDEALNKVRIAHEDLMAQGVNNSVFFMNEASYQALAGNLESSLDYLDRAITLGMVESVPITRGRPALAPLEGAPEFEAIQLRMIEHLNTERKNMGLEPIST